MRALAAGLLMGFAALAQAEGWLLGTATPALRPGAPFELTIAAPPNEPFPDRLDARIRSGVDERVVPLEAAAVAENGRRRYRGTLPAGMEGTVSVELAGRRVAGRSDLYRIDTVLEKPTPTEAEQRLLVPGLRAGYYLCFFGMHVLTPRAMEILGKGASTLSEALG